MEEDLALLISKKYIGDLVTTNHQDQSDFVIDVRRINSLVVGIQFKFQGKETHFRAMLSRQKEGILMRVQDKVAGDYILKGVSGFIYEKPNIHGGLLEQLNGFYFHISKSYRDQGEQDMYFLGKTHRRTTSIQPKSILSELITA